MKYSAWVGLLAAIAVIVACYLPWVYVAPVRLEIGGMYATGPQNFGRPGLMNCILAVAAVVLFLLPFIWAKRTNIFVTALNTAWAARNYILLSRCYSGECPIKKAGLYLLLAASLLMLIASFVPDIRIKEEKK
jgi:hypothetical protein